MIHWYKFVLLYLWIAPHVLLAGVAFLLGKRRLHLKYPVFFGYVCYEIVEFFLLFLVSQRNLNLRLYYAPIYLGTLVISTALRFGIIQEIFNNIFREQEQSETLARGSLTYPGAQSHRTTVHRGYFSRTATAQSALSVRAIRPLRRIAGPLWRA